MTDQDGPVVADGVQPVARRRGAIIGGIAGGRSGAGRGALIGGGGGALIGSMRREKQRQQEDLARQQWEREQANNYARARSEFNRAFGACMTGRGYIVN